MAAERRVIIPYRPRPAFLAFHNRIQRWASLNVHRRAGKTVAVVNDTNKAALTNNRTWPPPRYAYVAPYYKQAKRVAWGYAKYFSGVVPGIEFNESDLEIRYPNGATLRLFGADNPDALRGDYLDGVACDEFADWAPSVFPLVIRPMLADFGGWATFIGTPKGHNEFCLQHRAAEEDPERWFSMTLRASQSGLISAEELTDARAGMTAEQYEQEFECSFEAAILGAYFGKEIAQLERDGHICELPYERQLPVHTAWDLGIGDSTAIWFFQAVGSEIRVIDHYEAHGRGLPHYAGILAAKAYNYGNDYVPHDAKVRELGTGRTRIETLKELGRNPVLVPMHKIMDGINAARVSMPMIWFDRTACAEGIEALRQYRADFDEKTRAFKDNPRHDWTSHSADAFRYMAMAWREMAPAAQRKEPIRRLNVGIVGGATFNDLIRPLGERRNTDERV